MSKELNNTWKKSPEAKDLFKIKKKFDEKSDRFKTLNQGPIVGYVNFKKEYKKSNKNRKLYIERIKTLL